MLTAKSHRGYNEGMHPSRPKVDTVDEYIELFPPTTQAKLKQLRDLIKKTAPKAEERISYAIPAYKTGARSVAYFAAYEKHIGIYPIPRNIPEAIASKLKPYVAGKGTLRFQLDKPLPLKLIEEVFEYQLLKG